MNTGTPVGMWLPAFLLGLVLMVAFGGLVVALALRLTQGLTRTADTFFAVLQTQDYAAARACLSDEFRTRYDEAALRTLVASLGLFDVSHIFWNQRQMINGRGYLHGRVTTAQGDVVFVWIVLIKRHGVWKIHALHKPARGPLGFLLPFTSNPQKPIRP